MKKWLLVLGMITCLLGAGACGKTEDTASGNPLMTQEDALAAGDQLVESIARICSRGLQEQYQGDAAIAAALDSWTSAQKDMGDYVKISEHSAVTGADGVTVNVTVEGTVRNAKVEIILDKKLGISSITTNVVYSFGELMEKAALNTVLGMGTVFVILILISLIISCFTFIPKIQASFSKKAKEEERKPAAVDHTIAQIIEKEEQSDDLELVAVIAAAIAAGEGAASTDGFVVRSIRKRNF